MLQEILKVQPGFYNIFNHGVAQSFSRSNTEKQLSLPLFGKIPLCNSVSSLPAGRQVCGPLCKFFLNLNLNLSLNLAPLFRRKTRCRKVCTVKEVWCGSISPGKTNGNRRLHHFRLNNNLYSFYFCLSRVKHVIISCYLKIC